MSMKIRIQYRLFLALLAASGLAVFGMFFIMQWSIDRGFLQYVNTLEQSRLERLAAGLEEAYAGSGNWSFLRDDPAEWLRLMLRTLPEGSLSPEQRQRLEKRLERRAEQGRLPYPEGRLPGPAHRFESRVLLLDAEGSRILGPRGESDLTRTPLRHDGTVVGYLALLPQKELSDVHQLRFVQQQKLALALVGLVVLLVSTLLSLLLARRLVRPIQLLATATRQLAGGAYTTRVPAASGDELGQLARDFNALALTLEKNETARRQWVADISHELRTPLSVLRGEIEALQDGIRQPTAEAIASLHTEAMRLGRLVDDLYQLAVSDLGALSYRKEKTDFTALLREALASMRQHFADKGLTLMEELPASPLWLFADPQRLHQLLSNLLENTLKYTDAPGEARVSLQAEKSTAVLRIDDSPPGVPEESWTRLFESLYRVEGSRSRSTGGAGLGLAICRNIVQAHDGSITAGPSPLGGVRIAISFPLEKMP
jgi:two-component system sensor histidine kinase BaeS